MCDFNTIGLQLIQIELDVLKTEKGFRV
jgi:hypothetical protein